MGPTYSLALAKLKFYVSTGVHSIIWKGTLDIITTNQYYQRLYGDMCSRQTLEAAWNNCYRGAVEFLMDWWGRFDGILAEMSVIGIHKEYDLIFPYQINVVVFILAFMCYLSAYF